MLCLTKILDPRRPISSSNQGFGRSELAMEALAQFGHAIQVTWTLSDCMEVSVSVRDIFESFLDVLCHLCVILSIFRYESISGTFCSVPLIGTGHVDHV